MARFGATPRTVIGVTPYAERPPLCVNVVHHDLPAPCPRHHLFPIRGEANTPYLRSHPVQSSSPDSFNDGLTPNES